jgi:hypothetical protein
MIGGWGSVLCMKGFSHYIALSNSRYKENVVFKNLEIRVIGHKVMSLVQVMLKKNSWPEGEEGVWKACALYVILWKVLVK